jgi:hypothetical protein
VKWLKVKAEFKPQYHTHIHTQKKTVNTLSLRDITNFVNIEKQAETEADLENFS